MASSDADFMPILVTESRITENSLSRSVWHANYRVKVARIIFFGCFWHSLEMGVFWPEYARVLGGLLR